MAFTIPRPTEASARVPLPKDTAPPVKVTDPRRRGVVFIDGEGDKDTSSVVEISDSDSGTE